MKQKTEAPHFQKLFFRMVINDFLVNLVSGTAAALILFYLDVVHFGTLIRFVQKGMYLLLPFYLAHLFFLYYRLSRAWMPHDTFSELNMKLKMRQLKRLLSVSSRGTFPIVILWVIAGSYAYYFSSVNPGISKLMGTLALITFSAMAPVTWLVDTIVVRRILMSTARSYLETFPEHLLHGLNFFQMSSLNKSALAVFYLFLLAIFFTLIGGLNAFNTILTRNVETFGRIQLDELAFRIRQVSPEGDSIASAREIIRNFHNFPDSEITIIPFSKSLETKSLSGKKSFLNKWIVVEKDLPGLGRLVFRSERVKLSSKMIAGIAAKGVIVLIVMLLGVGIIVVFQVNREFKGTLTIINRITDAMADGNLGDAERLYATDEFWGLYQKLIVVKNNAGKVIRDIRDHSRLLNKNVRVVEEVSHFLQELAGGQKPIVRNAGDAVSFVDGFADNLQGTLNELFKISERTSSTSVEFAASINQVKNSMGKLVGLAESIAGTVHENTSSLKNVSTDLRTALGMAEQVETYIENFHDALSGRISVLTDSRYGIDRQVELRDEIDKICREIETHLGKLSAMYANYMESKVIMDKEISRIESIARIMDDFIDQAGILALNAAILAARNDSLDSGFGVIADEIKELGERTGASTREIRSIVNQTLHQLSDLEEGTKGAGVEFKSLDDLLNRLFSLQESQKSELETETERVHVLLDNLDKDRGYTGTMLDGVRLLKNLVTKMENGIGEQVRVTEKSMKTSDEMKEMAEQVMVAAQEQTVGANQIAGASESIRDLSADARDASGKVKEAIQDIVQLIQTIEENSEQMRIKADALRSVVDNFSGELTSLSSEIAKFQLPEN